MTPLPLLLRADCSTTNITLLGNGTLRSSCFLSTNQRIGIYAGTTAAALLINIARTITFYFLCVNASRVLHNRMFAAILRAPVLFFDTNPIGEQDCLSVAMIQHHSCLALPSAGRVLNRFAKDVGFLDDLLPYVFCEYLLVSVQPAKRRYLPGVMHTHCLIRCHVCSRSTVLTLYLQKIRQVFINCL